jgi:hypothetical protein
MDYLMEFQYFSFLSQTMESQDRLERYVRECTIIAEGKDIVGQIQIFNEGVGDKIKEKWAQFKAFIQKVFGKFLESMNKVMNTDVGYLEKYKDIILKKRLKDDTTFTMTDYEIGLRRLSSTSVPIFNYASLKPKLASADVYRKELIKEYDGKVEFPDYAKAYFMGGSEEKEIQPAALNMTDIYNFCHDKQKLISQIEKDQKTITNASLAQEAELKKVIADSGVKTEGFASYFDEKETYSVVKEQYITEFEINKPAGGTSTASSQPTSAVTDTDKKLSNNMNNVSGQNDKATEDEKKAQDAANKEKASSTALTDFENEVRVYNTESGTLLTAKMTAIHTMYSNYMKIIRKHVKDYVNDESTQGDQMANSGTDYSIENAAKQYANAKTQEEKNKIAAKVQAEENMSSLEKAIQLLVNTGKRVLGK